ncbi:unnamed protein product [Parnassius apollo]|uniref:(apollo) hypothetical protein n=1 Tax=Parnassius apollo TaxID=110799 RepID=A0A8S3XBW4_PARAO|nr:unnamed protein product [Parnassius apollo]
MLSLEDETALAIVEPAALHAHVDAQRRLHVTTTALLLRAGRAGAVLVRAGPGGRDGARHRGARRAARARRRAAPPACNYHCSLIASWASWSCSRACWAWRTRRRSPSWSPPRCTRT